ncbi:MAG: hypothetical protein H6Q59_2507 [Firmicutes bacterium]|nr:hypothetical protein [Bacillota bacterium]
MIGNVDLDLLEKTYQNASIGITAIESVLDKVKDQQLSNDLHKQLRDYQEIADKSKRQMRMSGTKAKDVSIYNKVMMKGNVKMNMLRDSSDSHIASMVLKGSTMGITQMTKLIHSKKDADGASTKIAEEFVKKEQDNIEVMKNYL